MNPLYSVVIPVFNSAKTIGQVIQRTTRFFEERNWDYELILVNDASRDQSWDILSRAANENSRVTAIDLARNGGQQRAIFWGMEKSRGDYVITLDDDLQNPPEEMVHLIEKAEEGYDLVFGRFREKRHSFIRRLGSLMVRTLNKAMCGKSGDLALSNFRIFRRDLVEQIISHRIKRPYIQGLALKFSKKTADVQVNHQASEEGKSRYTIYQIARTIRALLWTYASFWVASARKNRPLRLNNR